MNVLVIGANGNIGRLLVSKLSNSEHTVRAMIRDESQRAEMEKRGGEVVIADLEKDFDHALEGCNAVIFTAGSGAHTGLDKTELVDRQGAMKAVDSAKKNNVERFLIVSSMNADTPENGPESMQHYYRAKGDADEYLQKSGLTFTSVRPGRLTNEHGKGSIQVAEKIEDRGAREIPREDVANVMVAALDNQNTYNRIFEVLTGNQPIDKALNDL